MIGNLSSKLSENCLLLGTDNVRGQISEYIFEPNGGYCLYVQVFGFCFQSLFTAETSGQTQHAARYERDKRLVPGIDSELMFAPAKRLKCLQMKRQAKHITLMKDVQ